MLPLFLTMGLSGDYLGMVKDHEARHRAYCDRWGYAYVGITARADGSEMSGWDRISCILEHMATGSYSHVFWIDADSFVVDFNRDMRETLPSWAWLAMTMHPFPWGSWEPVHLQAGSFYLRSCPDAIAFLREILARRRFFKDEQQAMNFLLVVGKEAVRWQQGLRILPYQWNCSLNEHRQDPILAAFHGELDGAGRRALMLKAAERFPWR
jgi:hypothetical protein